MNDNGKSSTAKEVTSLADAIFNKCSAIGGSPADGVDRLFGELGGLLARAVERAHACAKRACA